MPILYENPNEVGPDRIANAIGAYDLYGGPASWSTWAPPPPSTRSRRPGEYLGGAIAPGVAISLDALFQQAAALRRVELVEPRSVIGQIDRRVDPVGRHVRLRRPGRRAVPSGSPTSSGRRTVVATGGLCRADRAPHHLGSTT